LRGDLDRIGVGGAGDRERRPLAGVEFDAVGGLDVDLKPLGGTIRATSSSFALNYCDGRGRPLVMLLSEGQMSDYKGAALMLPVMPKANVLLADKGYDADWLRAALAERGLAACIPSKSNRKAPIPMSPSSIANATRSKTCSDGSKIGGTSIPVTIVALIPTSRQSASAQSSPSGSDQ
jgi:transposase